MRFVVCRPMGDGRPGYWNDGEWWADQDKAKFYKTRRHAERVVEQYGGEIIEFTSKIENETVSAYDVLTVLKTVRNRANAETDRHSTEYQTLQRGARYAYERIDRILVELLEAQGIDVATELRFVDPRW
jgi:hypothetical protein